MCLFAFLLLMLLCILSYVYKIYHYPASAVFLTQIRKSYICWTVYFITHFLSPLYSWGGAKGKAEPERGLDDVSQLWEGKMFKWIQSTSKAYCFIKVPKLKFDGDLFLCLGVLTVNRSDLVGQNAHTLLLTCSITVTCKTPLNTVLILHKAVWCFQYVKAILFFFQT